MQTLNSPVKEVVNLQTSFLHHCKLFHGGPWSHLKTTKNKQTNRQHSVCLVWNDYLNPHWKNILVNRLNFQHFTKLILMSWQRTSEESYWHRKWLETFSSTRSSLHFHSWKSSIIIIVITVDSCANEYLVVANDIWNQWKQHITQFFWWNWFIFDPLNFSSVVSVLHSSLNDLQVNMGDSSVRQSIKTVPDKIIHFRHFCFSKTVKALVWIKNNLLFTQNTDTSF